MEVGLAGLLRTAWIASILPILLASVPCLSSRLSSFYNGLMVFAGRGKIMQCSSQKFSVPQKFFSHFYAGPVAWTTLLLVTTWMYAYNMAQLTGHSTQSSHIISVWRSVFLLLLMEVQVLRRLFETLYVFNYCSTARLHIVRYLIGYFFCYTLAPILCYNHAQEVYKFSVTGIAKFLFQGNTSVQAYDLSEFVIPFLKLGWLQWTGAAIFSWGWIHQRNCHKILGSLRKNKEQKNVYVIPYGDWFELIVSSPHYLSEIVMYVGFVVASGGSDLTVWLLLGFVVSNLTFAAAETHRWYLQKFKNYRNNRCSILPLCADNLNK
ncbi:LOW QUALITY PROTEIN: polyprenol reductase 1-like [Argentina anserina]|uniref:LOW QUALITY PROTEIN: polyprenol reductase 1-like n=1 Tax=Argentina anserina TaxID=57926 RepID=UPI0021768B09|nr:LOW QUALITY PROTEIN: polyprenol reductase 1-like [Potentilla anserina]